MASALYGWLQKGKRASPLLPSCDNPSSSTSAGNRSVEQAQMRECRKRGRYHHYDAEVRAKIAKHACEHGNKSATVKFTQELGHCVSESSVRNMKKAYLQKLKSVPDPVDITSLPHATLGRPLLVGSELDADIAEYARSLCLAGGIVNRSVVQAAAKGIISHRNAALLKEHGGPLEIGMKWTESFLRRHGYVKRKATKAARKIPAKLQILNLSFYRESAAKLSSMPFLLNLLSIGTKQDPS